MKTKLPRGTGSAPREPTRRHFVRVTLGGRTTAALLGGCGDEGLANPSATGGTGASGAGGGASTTTTTGAGAAGAGGAGVGGAGTGGAGGATCSVYPQETPGPFYLDLDLVRSDITDRTLRHWEYDGTTWKSVAVVTPPERRGARMVYDTFRKRVVLFGGRELQNDTWEYGSGAWSKRSPATSPSSRHGFCMAYDPSRRLTVLFGGGEGGNTLVGSETWEYDGETWRRGPDGPPTRRSCAMTYDPKKGRIMMFGGVYPVSGDGGFWNGARDDTWLY